MTAADQPTTEPSEGGLRIEHGWLVEETTGCTCAGGTEESSYLHEPGCGLTPLQRLDNLPGWPLAPAPQPAADTLLRDRLAEVLGDDVYVVGRVWEAWSHGTMTADDFTFATETDVLDDLVAAATLPAADTETEVQWGVRYHEGGKVIDTPMENEEHARSLARIVDATVVHRTVNKTPWEEA